MGTFRTSVLIALVAAALSPRTLEARLTACDAKTAGFKSTYVRVIGSSAEKSPAQATASLSRLLHYAVSKNRIPGGVIEFGGPSVGYWLGQGNESNTLRIPVTDSTLYDVASLTKLLVTATSVQLLADRGNLRLSEPIGKYIAELGGSPLAAVPIERLLRHRGGTRDISVPRVSDIPAREEGERIRADYLVRLARDGFSADLFKRGTFQYTDSAYVLLGVLVERLSRMPLDRFAAENLFAPLEMSQSRFSPPLAAACARTNMGRCVAHDPVARAFGGVSGNAGLFSTARDIGRFARMILNGGKFLDSGGKERVLLSPEAIRRMTTDAKNDEQKRGEGFDIDSPYACAPRGPFGIGSFGHTGYTGTSLWIDPATARFVVLLTNEVEIGKGPIDAIRWNVARVASRYGDLR